MRQCPHSRAHPQHLTCGRRATLCALRPRAPLDPGRHARPALCINNNKPTIPARYYSSSSAQGQVARLSRDARAL